MIKDVNKQLYVKPNHQRHRSDLGGLYSFVSVNSKRKSLKNQKRIIREVFSPPSKTKRKTQISYDVSSRYNHMERTDPYEARNFTPNVGVIKSFKHPEIHPSQRNLTSDGNSVRFHYNTNDVGSIQSGPGMYKPASYKSIISSNTASIPSKHQFVYITSNEYSNRKADLMGGQHPGVFKIPSQRVLLDHTNSNL
jgi:hypothetical protein